MSMMGTEGRHTSCRRRSCLVLSCVLAVLSAVLGEPEVQRFRREPVNVLAVQGDNVRNI